jgi:RNA polymerase sigma-70 factor (ECF subfamily)
VSDTFEHFFKRNYRDVEQRIRAAGASNDIAAEATQEAFVRAYQRWWRISHYGNPASWVQRVAINCRIDLERDRQRQSKVVRPLAVEAVEVDDDPDPRVEAAVDSLPPRQQAAVRAVYADGMTAVETADELGISPGAVRFHLNRARATLRPMLSSETTGQEV